MVRQKQSYQKQTHDYHAQERSSEVDDLVLAKNYRQGSPWLPGAIINKRSATSFLVQMSDNSVIHCHPDQLRHRSNDWTPVSESSQMDSDDEMLPWPDIPTSQESVSHLTNSNSRTVLRRSNRTRRPPDRFLPDN